MKLALSYAPLVVLSILGCDLIGSDSGAKTETASTPASQPTTVASSSAKPIAEKGDTATAGAQEAKPSKSAAPDASQPWLTPLVAPPAPQPGPAYLQRSLPARNPMFAKTDAIGWAKDSSDFGVCFTSDGLGAQVCTFVTQGGRVLNLHDHDGESPDPVGAAAIAQALTKNYSVPKGPGSWALGDSVSLSWDAPLGDEDANTVGKVEVLAKLKDVAEPVVVDRIPAPPGYRFIQPEALVLSPDGKAIGLVTHAFAGEFSDKLEVRTWTVEDFGARAFNTAGFAYHKKGDYKRAAELFHRAAHLQPEADKSMYNLACALALLDEPSTAAALGEAIRRGGDKVKTKAKKDSDFDAVRAEPWFAKLVN